MNRARQASLAVLFASVIVGLTAGGARAETIRVAIGTQDTTINTVHAGLLIRELKLLDKHLPRTGKYEGVTYEVEWKNFTSGPPLTGEMLAGKLDIGALGDFPSVLNGVAFQKQGVRSVYVAALSGSPFGAGNGLVVPQDSPVQKLADLKGKQISVPFGSAAHAMLLRAIRDLGWDPDRDVTLVSQSPEVGGTSLKAHKIDAHANFVPFAELFPFRGYARKIYDGSSVKLPTSHGVVARGEFADRYPELVVAFLKAVIEADRLLASEPEKYAELIHQVAGVNSEVVYMFHGPLGIQTRDLTIKPEVRDSLRIASDTLVLLKRADMPLDVNAWIDDRFIRQASRELGLDYDVRLKSHAPLALSGPDARTREAITEPRDAAQVWVKGEPRVRAYATIGSALGALADLEQKATPIRVAFVHDRQTGVKLFADKAWYVVSAATATPAAGKKPQAPGPKAAVQHVSAFLTRGDAEGWAKREGGEVLDFAGARRKLPGASAGIDAAGGAARREASR